MKCHNNSHVSELGRIAVFLASFILATASEAALYTTDLNWSHAAQSWTDAIWQPGSTGPIAGNTYEILPNGLLQNPRGDTPVFPGDALTVDLGACLRLRGTSPLTLSFPSVDGNPGLILNGGRLQAGDDNAFAIDGQIAAATNSLVDLGRGSHSLVITAQLSGGGDLTVLSGGPANSLDIQSMNNPYSGNWLVVRGNLKGTGGNSLGVGNITISQGTLEINYDIQTPGSLTLLGNHSVMVLHQDCRFSAVTINGADLAPGAYSYADLAAQFPGNFAEGGSGSIAVTPPIPVADAPPAAGDANSDGTDGSTIDASSGATNMAVADATAPATPNGAMALVNSSSQVTLFWNPTTDSGGSGLAGYQIYRARVLVGATTGTSYTDGGLTAGTQYCYTIIAYDGAGNNSSSSAQTCATTTPLIPAAPSNLMAAGVASTSVALNWQDNSNNEAGFEIERATTLTGPWSTVGLTGSNATSYTDDTVAPSTEYYYRVSAFN